MANLEEEMEGMMSDSKAKIDKYRKANPDTRTDTQKAKDHADFLERRKWKEQREEAQRQQIERFIKNQGTSSPRGSSY